MLLVLSRKGGFSQSPTALCKEDTQGFCGSQVSQILISLLPSTARNFYHFEMTGPTSLLNWDFFFNQSCVPDKIVPLILDLIAKRWHYISGSCFLNLSTSTYLCGCCWLCDILATPPLFYKSYVGLDKILGESKTLWSGYCIFFKYRQTSEVLWLQVQAATINSAVKSVKWTFWLPSVYNNYVYTIL